MSDSEREQRAAIRAELEAETVWESSIGLAEPGHWTLPGLKSQTAEGIRNQSLELVVVVTAFTAGTE